MDLVLQELERELENMDYDHPELEYDLRCEMEEAKRKYELAKERYEYYVEKRKGLEKAIQILKDANQK